MPTARGDLAVVAGADGRIYAIGGASDIDAPALSVVEAYDPAADVWTTVASLPHGRAVLAAALGPDGRIYAIGGDPCDPRCFSPSPTIPSTAIEVDAYSPSTNTWETVAPLPTPRSQLAAATGSDGRIYAISGFNYTNMLDDSIVEAYDTTTDTWRSVARTLTPHVSGAAVFGPDDRVYIVGGQWCCRPPLNSVEAYQVAGNVWKPAPSMGTGRTYLAVASLDGSIYAFGGCPDLDNCNDDNPTNTAEALDVLAQANVVKDGSFEWPKAPGDGTRTYIAPQRFADWHVASGSIDIVDRGYWQAAVGKQSLDLSGVEAGDIFQNVPTIPGQQYRVLFSMAGNVAGPPTVKQLEVLWDGQQVGVESFDTTGHTSTDMGWVAHRLTVTATGTNSRLEFRSLTDGTNGPALDRVRVMPVTG